MTTVIFDLDGTLANTTHRLHYVRNGRRDWDKFFEECHNDAPIEEMLALLRNLNGAYKRVIVSGRSKAVREKTIAWLEKHDICNVPLYMRPVGDYRKDHTLKKEILNQLLAEGNQIAFVVDDRPTVVEMWRRHGRSGRMLWMWMMREAPLGFLHTWYYQSLS